MRRIDPELHIASKMLAQLDTVGEDAARRILAIINARYAAKPIPLNMPTKTPTAQLYSPDLLADRS